MVRHGAAGVILADHSPETLRDTIAGLLADPHRRSTLGHNARLQVEQRLNVQTTANRLFDIIRAAASNRPELVAKCR